ncbi:glycosyltransferase [Candidatus Pacearchaeota archaeon]|nr:glycosyltransferase [Candidatus Pacearchaeota archaeon]
MKDAVLLETSLCAIVRDEKMNPAGGIMRFLAGAMPHVGKGVVVDTGSKDGTRELLERAKKDFSHLSVYDTPFKGYAEARNSALKRVKTKRALILDADEIILQKDFTRLAEMLNCSNAPGFSFNFVTVHPDGAYDGGVGHYERLFDVVGMEFYNMYKWKYESLRTHEGFKKTDINVYHFIPRGGIGSKKLEYWYHKDNISDGVAPSQVCGFDEWKAYNLQRDLYVASNLDRVVETEEEALEAF